MNETNWRPYFAEFMGTLGFVFVAAGSVVAEAAGGDLGLLGVALAQGLMLAALIYASGRFSGGHLNPAVTIGAWLAGKINAAKAVGYVVSQLVGGVAAAYLVRSVFPAASALAHVGAPELAPGVALGTAILVEAAFTFFLVGTILMLAPHKNETSAGLASESEARMGAGHLGLAAGFVVAAGILVAGRVSGGVFNPARAFGPAFVSETWVNHSVWWIGPLVGAAIAAIVYRVLASARQQS